MRTNLLQRKTLGGRLAQILIGLILSMLIFPPNLQAQFGGPVTIIADTSPTTISQLETLNRQSILQSSIAVDSKESRVQDYLEYVKQAQRWIETVNHYTRTIFEYVRQFTSLKGIMGVVEKQLGLDDDTLKALSDIGQLVRGVFELKRQFLALIRTRLAMIQNLETRAKNGIFDPRADLNDLEEYLRSSIGRSAQEVIATRERLAQFDNELERWTWDLGRLRAKKTVLEKKLNELKTKIERETSLQTRPRVVGSTDTGDSTTVFNDQRVSTSANAISTMTLEIQQIETQLLEIDKQISELIDKITERYKRYHLRFDEAKKTGEDWQKSQDAWQEFMEVKEGEIENLIDYYGQNRTN